MSKTKREELREYLDRKGVVWGRPETYDRVGYRRWREGFELLDKVPRESRTPWEQQFYAVAYPMVLNKETARTRKTLDLPPIEVLSDAQVDRVLREMLRQQELPESAEEIELRQRFEAVDLNVPSTWTRVCFDDWRRYRQLLTIRAMNAPLKDRFPFVVDERRSEPMGRSLTEWDRNFLDVTGWVDEANSALQQGFAGDFASAPPSHQATILLSLWLAEADYLLNPIRELSRRIQRTTDRAARARMEAERRELLIETFARSRKGKRGSLIPDDWRLLRMFEFCRGAVSHVATAYLAGGPPAPDVQTCGALIRGLATLQIPVRATAASIRDWGTWRRVSSVSRMPSDRIVSLITYSLMGRLLSASSATVQDRVKKARRRYPRHSLPNSEMTESTTDPLFARWLVALGKKLDQEATEE